MTDLEIMQSILIACAVALMAYGTYLYLKLRALDRAIARREAAEASRAE